MRLLSRRYLIRRKFKSSVFHTPSRIVARACENGIIDTFLAILELAGSRFGASSLLNILESPAVQGRFKLAPADLETIRVWIDKAAFAGASTRRIEKSLGCPLLPRTPGGTGLTDLFLGYALPGGNSHLFKNILPCDEIEGSLGRNTGEFH